MFFTCFYQYEHPYRINKLEELNTTFFVKNVKNQEFEVLLGLWVIEWILINFLLVELYNHTKILRAEIYQR